MIRKPSIETAVRSNTLSDGSTVFHVSITDDTGTTICADCRDEHTAHQLQLLLTHAFASFAL